MKFLKPPVTSFFFSEYKVFESLQNIVLSIYVFIIFLLIGVIIVEIKHIYNIDIFPGLDTPFDNLYYHALPNGIDCVN